MKFRRVPKGPAPTRCLILWQPGERILWNRGGEIPQQLNLAIRGRHRSHSLSNYIEADSLHIPISNPLFGRTDDVGHGLGMENRRFRIPGGFPSGQCGNPAVAHGQDRPEK